MQEPLADPCLLRMCVFLARVSPASSYGARQCAKWAEKKACDLALQAAPKDHGLGLKRGILFSARIGFINPAGP